MRVGLVAADTTGLLQDSTTMKFSAVVPGNSLECIRATFPDQRQDCIVTSQRRTARQSHRLRPGGTPFARRLHDLIALPAAELIVQTGPKQTGNSSSILAPISFELDYGALFCAHVTVTLCQLAGPCTWNLNPRSLSLHMESNVIFPVARLPAANVKRPHICPPAIFPPSNPARGWSVLGLPCIHRCHPHAAFDDGRESAAPTTIEKVSISSRTEWPRPVLRFSISSRSPPVAKASSAATCALARSTT